MPTQKSYSVSQRYQKYIAATTETTNNNKEETKIMNINRRRLYQSSFSKQPVVRFAENIHDIIKKRSAANDIHI
jgi:hypothetical protein